MQHLEAGWELGVGPKLCAQVARLELRGEALVGGPEEADVSDGELDHRQPLQAQAEGPAGPPGEAVLVDDLLLHHPAGPETAPLPR